jgi:hypothetical protein
VSIYSAVGGVGGVKLPICSIHDQEERAATELQIREFGQTPRRLFVLPHPSRLSRHGYKGVVEEEVCTVGATTEGLSRIDSSNSWGQSSLSSPTMDDKDWVFVGDSGEGLSTVSIFKPCPLFYARTQHLQFYAE